MNSAAVDLQAIRKTFHALCEAQPRRYSLPVDIDRIVTTEVNVPFPTRINADTLARALKENRVPRGWAGHLARFLNEVSLTDILRFCDRHQTDAKSLARFLRKHHDELALHRPALEEHVNAVAA